MFRLVNANQNYFYFPYQFLKGSINSLFFSPVSIVECNLLTETIYRNHASFIKYLRRQTAMQRDGVPYRPVSDEARVDVSVLPLVPLLRYGHLANRSAQSCQKQTREQQIAQQTSGTLQRSRQSFQT